MQDKLKNDLKLLGFDELHIESLALALSMP